MANRKISDLTALTATATGDLLPIVDISEAAAADKNKKITVENLFKGIPGNVGIGTSSPVSTLDVKGGTTITSLADWNTKANTVFELANPAVRLGIGYNSSDQVLVQAFDSSNASRSLALQPYGGSVGIGTASPAYALDIVGSPGVGLQIFETTSANTRRLRITQESIGVTYDATFGTGDNAHRWLVGGSERARIDSSGRVGIGTSSPGARLQVNAPSIGRSYSSSVLDFSNIHLDGITADATTSALTFSSGSGGGAAIAFSRGGSFQTEISFWTCSTAVANSATERLRIDSSGNVGIGTSSPTGLLTVATATAGTAADFVIGNPANLWSIKTGTTTNALTIVDTQFSVERLRIDSSGRLLVGTSSDSGGALLQVNGDRIRVGTAKTPASASATGTTGEICWDANYIYVCTATNTWKRTAIATW